MSHGTWHDLIHAAAAVALVGGGALFVVLSVLARREPARPTVARPPASASDAQLGPVLGLLAATLAVAAGLIHLAAAPSHIDELGPLGWGFIGAALFQGAWALSYAIQPTRGVTIAGIAGSLAIVAGWAWTRTAGLPVGPLAGVPEAIGVPDAAATTFELLLVGLLGARLSRLESRLAAALRRLPDLPAIAVVPAVGVVFLATTLAVSLALDHGHAPGTTHEAAGGIHAPAGH